MIDIPRDGIGDVIRAVDDLAVANNGASAQGGIAILRTDRRRNRARFIIGYLAHHRTLDVVHYHATRRASGRAACGGRRRSAFVRALGRAIRFAVGGSRCSAIVMRRATPTALGAAVVRTSGWSGGRRALLLAGGRAGIRDACVRASFGAAGLRRVGAAVDRRRAARRRAVLPRIVDAAVRELERLCMRGGRQGECSAERSDGGHD